MLEEQVKSATYLFLKETAPVYNLVKRYSILIEELIPSHKAPIHAANELKGVIFHLYNVVLKPGNLSTDIIEAQEHLCRAFYDLHSLAVTIYIEGIASKLNIFKLSTITASFSEYGSIIRPTIREIQEKLREVRSNRNTDIKFLVANLSLFSDQIKLLAKFDDITESMLPDMTNFEKEKRKAKTGERLWDIAKVLVGGISGAVLSYFVSKL